MEGNLNIFTNRFITVSVKLLIAYMKRIIINNKDSSTQLFKKNPMGKSDISYESACFVEYYTKMFGKHLGTCLGVIISEFFDSTVNLHDVFYYKNFKKYPKFITEQGLNQILPVERNKFGFIRINNKCIKFDTFMEFYDFMDFWGNMTYNHIIDMYDVSSEYERPINKQTMIKQNEMIITSDPYRVIRYEDDYEDRNLCFYENYHEVCFGRTFNCLDKYINGKKHNVNKHEENKNKCIGFDEFLLSTDFTFVFETRNRMVNFIIILSRMEKLL